MGKSRTSKTMAAGMALGLTAYSKQFGDYSHCCENWEEREEE